MLRWLLRLAVLFVTLTLLMVAAFLLYSRWRAGMYSTTVLVEGGSPGLNAVEHLYLQTYLSSRAQDLNQPVGAGNQTIVFEVAPGQNADQIGANLLGAGLLSDLDLFKNYVRFYGLDSQLEAGIFQLSPTMSTAEIAVALTEARRPEVVVRFLEGWRLEEMAESLREAPAGQIDPDQFEAIGLRRQVIDLSPYPFLASLPADATLEGFLFPDTYRLDATATAADLVDSMLRNFDERVTPALRQQMGQQGLDLYDSVTLASIMEREAVIAEERPLIARVFLNRLTQGIHLNADPTLQYPLGRQVNGSWWKQGLTQADIALDTPYNTYLYTGLPPGPIANPGLASLEAVGNPAESDFLYFVADCDSLAPGSHIFALTYEAHLENVSKCR